MHTVRVLFVLHLSIANYTPDNRLASCSAIFLPLGGGLHSSMKYRELKSLVVQVRETPVLTGL